MRPTRKRLGLVAKAGALMTAAAAAAMLAPPAAHAATASSTVVRATRWVDGCEAILYSNSADQVSAGVYISRNADTSYECTGWLIRQADNASDWRTISGYHTVSTPGTSAYTGWYNDSWRPSTSRRRAARPPRPWDGWSCRGRALGRPSYAAPTGCDGTARTRSYETCRK